MEKETKKCPYCGEEILAVAKKCRYCGEWLPVEAEATIDAIKEPHDETVPVDAVETSESVNSDNREVCDEQTEEATAELQSQCEDSNCEHVNEVSESHVAGDSSKKTVAENYTVSFSLMGRSVSVNLGKTFGILVVIQMLFFLLSFIENQLILTVASAASGLLGCLIGLLLVQYFFKKKEKIILLLPIASAILMSLAFYHGFYYTEHPKYPWFLYINDTDTLAFVPIMRCFLDTNSFYCIFNRDTFLYISDNWAFILDLLFKLALIIKATPKLKLVFLISCIYPILMMTDGFNHLGTSPDSLTQTEFIIRILLCIISQLCYYLLFVYFTGRQK